MCITHADICIICALPEEAEAFIAMLQLHCGVACKEGTSSARRSYRYATIANQAGEDLLILISWLPNYGPIETSLHLQPLLQEFQPRFVAMTGICAGDRNKVKLGDLVVASQTFNADSGKIITDATGHRQQLYATTTSHVAREVLQFIRMFQSWQIPLAKLSRPSSLKQQHDWLLQQLLTKQTPHIDDIPFADLERHAPAWRTLTHAMQTCSPPLLTAERTLADPTQIQQLHYGPTMFPYRDPQQPRCWIEPMASCNAVRGDNPFQQIQVPVRNTVAIDMEGAAFYQALEDSPHIPHLLVKGVCDYADSEKDDSYHQYASQASALYVLCFLQKYVTAELMPRPQQEPAPQPEEPHTPTTKITNNIGNISSGTVHINQGQNITHYESKNT